MRLYINHDFRKRKLWRSSVRLRRRRWQLLLSLIMAAGMIAITPYVAQATRAPLWSSWVETGSHLFMNVEDIFSSGTQAIKLPLPVVLSHPTNEEPLDDLQAILQQLTTSNHIPQSDWQPVTVKQGDSLLSIFTQMKIDRQQIYTLLNASQEVNKAFAHLQVGQRFWVKLDSEHHEIMALIYPAEEMRWLIVAKQENGYEMQFVENDIETRITYTIGTISPQSSFYQTAQEANLADSIILQFSEILGYDIDFTHDIHPGDRFIILHKSFYNKGEKFRDGPILAAEFMVQGKSHRAIQYFDEFGKMRYYTPDGKGVKKPFMRNPVDFRRITSGFLPERYHPILGVKRPHRGVDYAAPIGTPVKAVGEGKVISLGTKGGYGNTIILQHDDHHTTLYAHLSGFREGLKEGSQVEQEEVIGYVGMTGLATGPHLHYEFRVDDAHYDPLTVQLPVSEDLPIEKLPNFSEKIKPILDQLNVLTKHRVAVKSQE